MAEADTASAPKPTPSPEVDPVIESEFSSKPATGFDRDPKLRLSGSQDPTVNNGKAESTVTLGPRQGLIMVKQ